MNIQFNASNVAANWPPTRNNLIEQQGPVGASWASISLHSANQRAKRLTADTTQTYLRPITSSAMVPSDIASTSSKISILAQQLAVLSLEAPAATAPASISPVASQHSQSTPGSRHRRRTADGSGCPLCKKNGETQEYYQSHELKDEHNVVRCPVLRAYVCPHCKATGDCAHTESYCPIRPTGRGPSLSRGKVTRRSATGKPRTCRM